MSNLTFTCVSLPLQLSDVEKGGSTVFLKSGISVSPLKVTCLSRLLILARSLVILEYDLGGSAGFAAVCTPSVDITMSYIYKCY